MLHFITQYYIAYKREEYRKDYQKELELELPYTLDEKDTINKIQNYINDKTNKQETLNDAVSLMEREIKRLEKISIITLSSYCDIFDSILNVFIKQEESGGDRLEFILSLRKEITVVLDDAEEKAKTEKWKEEHKKEFDELFSYTDL